MFCIGVDLGQRADYTAIAVLERLEAQVNGFDYVQWRQRSEWIRGGMFVRYLQRMKLGTSYPRVVDRIGEIVQHREIRGQCRVAIDATGVGAPVVDMIRGSKLDCDLMPVVITGGDRAHRAGSSWYVPKMDLLGGLQVALELDQLKIARNLKETPTLVKELMDVSVRTTASSRVRLGADGAGQHDDLVMAVALACWFERREMVGLRGDGPLVIS